VPCRDQDVEYFLERIAARLSGFPLQEVEDLVAALGDDVVESQDDRCACIHRRRSPRCVGRTRAVKGLHDRPTVVIVECSDDLAGERSPHLPHPVTTISTRWNSFRSL
jgi:hypothetical protein